MHDRGSFFQVLEGPTGPVLATLERIRRDPRHQRIVVLVEEPIATRGFASWTMGYAQVSRQAVAQEPGLNDVFGGGASLASISSGVARRLATAFREGRLRAAVS